MSPDDQRQLVQMLLTARHYLRLASVARNLAVTCKEVGDKVGPGTGEVPADACLPFIVGAHLGSCASRLAGIEDLLDDNGQPSADWRDYRRLSAGQGVKSDDEVRMMLPKWVHGLLRDQNSRGEHAARSRRLVEGTTLRTVIALLQATHDRLEGVVRGQGGVPKLAVETPNLPVY